MIVNNNLVGGFCDSFNHLEKYEIVNGKDDIPYMKCLKPPTSFVFWISFGIWLGVKSPINSHNLIVDQRFIQDLWR